MPFECFGVPAGDTFESSVQRFVPVFMVVVVAVLEELAELGGGEAVAAKFGQFVGVHPDTAFGAVGGVRDFDFSVQCCVLRWFCCSKG